MGYSINDLRKADKLNGNDAIPIQSNGQTKQIEAGVMDQGTTITAGGSQNTGNIRREQLFILNNNSTQINLTIGNAVGRSVSNNEYQDSAAAATGWIIRIYNKSTRSHVIIYGANSWTIAAGEMQEYFWTGSAWTYHHIVTSTELNNALTDYAQGKQTALPTGADLNNYKDRGEYLATTDAIGNSCINRPNAQSSIYGFSMSVHNSGNGIITQKLYSVFGVFARRYSNTWTSWEQIATKSDLIQSLPYNSKSNITNCNTVSDGIFCAMNVANTPSDAGNGYVFISTYSFNNDGNYRFQTCYPISNGNIYIRYKTGGTWTGWTRH